MPLAVWLIVSMVLSYAITVATLPKPVDAKAASEGDFKFPQTEEGTPQPVIFGDVWVSSWTILDILNFRTTGIERDSGGKK